ncbi:MAG TPA: sigma factor, partial [Candidatus Limnocylindrales bacterium]|nr:sigma factor [Candidatus Limnocylindrales bacterium]
MRTRREEPRIGPAIDRSTIDRARNGDRDAFELIVRARKDAVYRLSFAILGNEADARDAMQDTLVAAWRQLRGLRNAHRFDAWLQRIVVNVARQLIRTKQRRRTREIPASTVESLAGIPAPANRDVVARLRPIDRRLQRRPWFVAAAAVMALVVAL